MDNWLINLLALIILGVVLDGARRAYLKHKDSVKVSRNLSRSMRQEMADDDILSTPRKVKEESDWQPPVQEVPAAPEESELEYIDPEEAEKRRQIAAELPGTVRVVQRRKPEDASQVNRQVQKNFHSSRKPLAGSKPDRGEDTEMVAPKPAPGSVSAAAPVSEPVLDVPQQASLNLEEQVPTLMDSVEPVVAPRSEQSMPFSETAEGESASDSSHFAPSVEAEVAAPDPLAALSADGEEPQLLDRREPSLDESVSLESLQAVPEGAEAEQEESPAKKSWAAPDLKLPELKFPDLKKSASVSRESSEPSSSDTGGRRAESDRSKRPGKRSENARTERAVEEVLILNIMAPSGDCFEGNDLLRVLLSSGLRFGDMNIFHYHCGEAGEGPALFSLANIVVPGTFDMSDMEEFTTPGVSLFLALPAEVEALKAFDTLLSTARNIAEQLGGELKDENRSVFTAQTAEHYRQRVMEFQRRKALARAQA
ncbi:cell division protein ZipA [Microbulbifer agarilyticus]|uniref:cell division protein ZipA n=1 Tax=Microbulbifer agarilyticus TaxID=260552 RepID=UPI001C97FC02|nr:cell division protein ZipA [Microbulbifer agarilyticus]MBY6189050.1 cell division protein ZipA [Microbulbifer agarilyticus]